METIALLYKGNQQTQGAVMHAQVSAPLALSMLQDMTALQRLNLQSFADLTDAHMSMLSTRLTTLQQLKVNFHAPPTTWTNPGQARAMGLALA